MAERKYAGEWKHVPLPVPEPTGDVKGVRIPNGKCMIDGEQIIVKMQILPVDGSVQEHVTGELKGKAIKHADRTGDCPECDAHVPLSTKGFVTAHVVKGGTAEPSSVLTEPQVAPTDTGSRVGDPRSAGQRRTVEIDGAFERGTVEIPVKGKSGRIKLEEAPATEENVRAALDYWRTRKIVRPAANASADKMDRWKGRCARQSEHVSTLTRRLEAMRKGTVALTAKEAPEALISPSAPPSLLGGRFKAVGTSPGPALVKGRSEPTMAGEVTVRQVGEPYVRPEDPEDKRQQGDPDTSVGPTGRDRMDKESSTVPIVGGTFGCLTQAQFDALGCDHSPLGIGVVCDSSDCARRFRTRSRKYWERIRKQEAYAAARRAEGRKRLPVRLGTAGMGSSSFAEGDSRETEQVMRQAPRS